MASRAFWEVVLVLLAAILREGGTTFVPDSGSSAIAAEKEQTPDEATSQSSMDKKQLKHFNKSCEEVMTLECLKAAMADLVPTLAVHRSLQIWPGLSLMSGGFIPEDPPSEQHSLDSYLANGLNSFLSSISLHVQILDGQVQQGLFNFNKTDNSRELESRKKGDKGLLWGGIMSGGMLMAMGLAAVSAMAGKSLLMSVMAMGLTMLNKMGGDKGGDNGSKKYEVIHTTGNGGEEDTRRWAHFIKRG